MVHDIMETPTNLRTLLILEILGKSDPDDGDGNQFGIGVT